MRLVDLLTERPEAFYPQTWYAAEAFLKTEADPLPPIRGVIAGDAVAADFGLLPFAVQVVAQLLDSPAWANRYVWCADRDHLGQRIYVGQNGHGIEIHRHLYITDRFGIASW